MSNTNTKNELENLKFGAIVFMDFSPAVGHEQKGYRPAIVISSPNPNLYNMISVAPITNTDNGFPLHVPLGSKTKTKGFIIMEQIKSIDMSTRKVRFVEHAPQEVTSKVRETFKALYEDALE